MPIAQLFPSRRCLSFWGTRRVGEKCRRHPAKTPCVGSGQGGGHGWQQTATVPIHDWHIEGNIKPRLSLSEQALFRSQDRCQVSHSLVALSRFESSAFCVLHLRHFWLLVPPSSRSGVAVSLMSFATTGWVAQRQGSWDVGGSLWRARRHVCREAGGKVSEGFGLVAWTASMPDVWRSSQMDCHRSMAHHLCHEMAPHMCGVLVRMVPLCSEPAEKSAHMHGRARLVVVWRDAVSFGNWPSQDPPHASHSPDQEVGMNGGGA